MDEVEAVEKLNSLKGDPEDGHRNAERILCEFLKASGFATVADAFDAARDRLDFWYA